MYVHIYVYTYTYDVEALLPVMMRYLDALGDECILATVPNRKMPAAERCYIGRSNGMVAKAMTAAKAMARLMQSPGTKIFEAKGDPEPC